MSDIDTEITGSPSSIQGTASFLRDTLAVAVSSAADAVTSARSLAGGSWNTTAGEGFRTVTQRMIDGADDLDSSSRTLADDLDEFATSLQTCQEDMTTARTDAVAGGLQVDGFIIRDPGPRLDRPSLGEEPTPVQADRHQVLLEEWRAQNDLVTAFTAAGNEADRVDRAYQSACETLNGRITPGEGAGWLLNAGEIIGQGTLAGTIAVERIRLLARADELFTLGTAQMAEVDANSGLFDRRYRRFSWLPFFLDRDRIAADRLAAQGLMDEAEELRAQARGPAAGIDPGRVGRIMRVTGRILGPAGFLLGVHNDIQSGESQVQAVVSQGAGFAAGVGAGMAVGAIIGSIVPGPGTVVGAVVGGVVGAGAGIVAGIFTDGAVDSFFENGPDVGAAFAAGGEALGDTVESIGDLAGGAVDAIGGWFD